MTNLLMKLVAQKKAQFSRVKTIKAGPGRSRYRLLPSWRSVANAPAHFDEEGKGIWASQPWYEFGQHFLKDAAGQVKSVYTCQSVTHGTDCRICNELARATAAGPDELTAKRLKDAGSSKRVLLNVLHLDGQTPDQVQVLELPPSALYGKKGTGGILSALTDWPNIFSAEGDADLIIEKGGTGLDTTYAVSFVPTSVKVVPPHVLAKLVNLDSFGAGETMESLQRSLAATSAITGLLPSAASTRPSLSAAATMQFDDVPDSVTMPAAAPAPTPAPAAAAPAPAPQVAPWQDAPAAATTSPAAGGLDDLEDLLSKL